MSRGNGSTGPVNEWMSLHGIATDSVAGWCAIYAKAKQPPVVYRSKDGVDPSTLPANGLQLYYVFWRLNGKVYTTCFSGYDEVAVIGRRKPVAGTQLRKARFYGEITKLGWKEWEVRHEYANYVFPTDIQF